MTQPAKFADDMELPEIPDEEPSGVHPVRERKPWTKESGPHSVKPFVPDWSLDKSLLPKHPPNRKRT